MKQNFIELEFTIASVKTKKNNKIIQISDAGATLTLSVVDWGKLKKYIEQQL